MINLNQLNKIPVNAGDYLLLPSSIRPLYIIPINSSRAFKIAVDHIKPKNKFGKFKKLILKNTPVFILRRIFASTKISNNNKSNEGIHLILPWNQGFRDKYTIINIGSPTTLVKVGFGFARHLVKKETGNIKQNNCFDYDIFPRIIKTEERDGYNCFESEFFAGHHPEQIPQIIVDYFDERSAAADKVLLEKHPYVLEIIEFLDNNLIKKKCKHLVDNAYPKLKKHYGEMLPIVFMHGDCTATNIISYQNTHRLVDWEEGRECGMPIDVVYFKFRRRLDAGFSWKINNKIDLLAVLHYTLMLAKYNKFEKINSLKWNKNTIVRK